MGFAYDNCSFSWHASGCMLVLGVFMSKKKSRPGRASSASRPRRNRGPSVASRNVPANGRSNREISIDSLTVSEIVGQPLLFEYFETHPLQSILCQIALLSVATAGAGILISKFVPDASSGGVGHGVYVFGVLMLLVIETLYQWLLRSAVLSVERGAFKLGRERFPGLSEEILGSVLLKGRDVNEARLKRLFEPIQRVGLIAAGLSILFVGQRAKDGFLLDSAGVLSQDWAMTVMFALAGLFWQLKNPDNIGRLLEHLNLERRFTSFGERFWTLGLVVPTVASMGVISWCFMPWGLVSFVPLFAALYFVVRYLGRRSAQ